jgi:alkanesulfonate monooxygenase SsuD/methylene tetrahydromethanopterin reductase-like flavin-dependent oxidoreductase (luciferase family)
VSHPVTMGAWHGAEVVKPRTASVEALRILAQLEAGERSDVDGEVLSSRKFRLAISPTPPPTRRYLAAMGPRMLQTAGEHAHGTLLNWSSPDEVERAGGIVRDAAAAAGRDRPEIAAYVRVAVAEDRDDARHALAREIGSYCALPAYAAHFERQGLGDAVERVKAAHKAGGGPGELADALGEETLARLGWYGTPADDLGGALERYRRAGLDHLVARVVVTGDDAVADVHRVVRALDPHTTAG